MHDRLHAGEHILNAMVELIDEQLLGFAGLHLRRDVAAIADEAIASVR
jgi:hypothetical protein